MKYINVKWFKAFFPFSTKLNIPFSIKLIWFQMWNKLNFPQQHRKYNTQIHILYVFVWFQIAHVPPICIIHNYSKKKNTKYKNTNLKKKSTNLIANFNSINFSLLFLYKQ